MQCPSPIPICGMSHDLLPQLHCWLWAKDVSQQHCYYSMVYTMHSCRIWSGWQCVWACKNLVMVLLVYIFPFISVLIWTSFRLAFRCHFELFHRCYSLYDSWQFYCLRQGSYFFTAVFICQQDYSKSTEPIYPELSGLMVHGSERGILHFGADPA